MPAANFVPDSRQFKFLPAPQTGTSTGIVNLPLKESVFLIMPRFWYGKVKQFFSHSVCLRQHSFLNAPRAFFWGIGQGAPSTLDSTIFLANATTTVLLGILKLKKNILLLEQTEPIQNSWSNNWDLMKSGRHNNDHFGCFYPLMPLSQTGVHAGTKHEMFFYYGGERQLNKPKPMTLFVK